MINLNDTFSYSLKNSGQWSIHDFYDYLEFFKKEEYKISFWEDEELCAQIIANNEVVGYLWLKYPIIAIKEDIYIPNKGNINIIIYPNLTEKIFEITDINLKNKISPELISPFSLEDLWFHTV